MKTIVSAQPTGFDSSHPPGFDSTRPDSAQPPGFGSTRPGSAQPPGTAGILLPLVIVIIMLIISSCKDEDVAVNAVALQELTPEFPTNMQFGEYVYIDYTYTVVHSEGARIWVQPYTEGSISPGYVYSSSGVFTGEGNRKVIITVNFRDENEVVVDQLRVLMRNPDQSQLLFEEFIDVEYTFGDSTFVTGIPN